MAQDTTDADRPNHKSGSRREREFRRYGEAVLGMRGAQWGEDAFSSKDVSLTAFAQLVALRLNVKRALISLFSKSEQYVLAEATRTLSLQQDDVHDDHDALFWGTTVIPRGNDFASETLRLARKMKTQKGTRAGDAALIVPDFRKHDRFHDHAHVTGAPYARAFAGVPLLAPSGFPIGTLSIMHDEPRPQGLTWTELQFMRDVGTSVMKHMEMKRVETASLRGTMMVKGLSRFMEGKYSIEEISAYGGNEIGVLAQRHDTQTTRLSASARTHSLNTASNNERITSARETQFWRQQTPKTFPERPSQSAPIEARRMLRPSLASVQVRRPMESPEPSQKTQSVIRPTLKSTPSDLQKDVVSKDVPEAFQRAALIIRQATSMAGVIFLDAVPGEFGRLRSPTASTSSSDGTSIGFSSSGTSGTEVSSTKQYSKSKICRYLGAAYEHADDGTDDISHHNVPERFLRSVLRRYPHGKIYNFGDDGLLPSDSGSESNTSTEQKSSAWENIDGAQKKPKKSAYDEGSRLQQIFPGARALAVMPMWDPLRGRFYAGAVVWSYDRHRLFSYQEDLNYLGAFCDVVMAEVTRLDIQADVQAKTNFISSISHELRSPLHGILGGVEVLQEEDGDLASTRQMTNMIDTCGRSLLDIVNNLLEHARVTSSTRSRQLSLEARRRKKTPNTSQDVHDIARLTEEVLDSAFWQTPEPAARSKSAEQAANFASQVSHEPLKVALDLYDDDLPESGWSFHVNAGAYRRILQNLTNNAIKYTDRGGYFKVSMSVSKSPTDSGMRMIEMECIDSGRGMSEEYLRNGLYQAFNQEDSHSQGTGLGLSLVKGLVEGMGGTIEVRSTKGQGTTISLKLPMTPASSTVDDQEEEKQQLQWIKGLRYSMAGFGSKDDQGPRAALSADIVKASIQKVFTDLQLEAHQPEDTREPDLHIITELQASTAASERSTEQRLFQNRPCLIFCDSITSSRTVNALCRSSMANVQVVAQPLGRKQLLKAIVASFSKTPGEMRPEVENDKTNTPNKRRHLLIETPASDSSEMNWTRPISSRSQSPSTPTMPRRPSSASTYSVLVVDDNPVNLHLLQRYIKKIGRTHVGATNGQEAVEAYERSHPSAQRSNAVGDATTPIERPLLPVSMIFMDITMPIMDGLEATRQIRRYERARGLKPAMIVALTALASPQAKQEAYGSGVDLFLTKPVRFKELAQMFKDWDSELQDHNNS